MPLQQFWLKALTLVVIVQQSSYWGYRFGRDQCLFKDCVPSNEAVDNAMRAASMPFAARRRDLDVQKYPTAKPRRGIVLTSQCSGSEWVVSSLNNVPGVTWHLERMIRYSRTYMKDAEWETVPWKTYRQELEQAFTFTSGGPKDLPEITPKKDNTKGLRTKMVGFKLMYDQIPQHLRFQFAEWLEENQVFVVHLRRKCAALQWSSQMEKYMRGYRFKIKKDHIYSQKEKDALPPRNWNITLVDRKGFNNRWLESIHLLEENQNEFANYLHVFAAKVPVFEFNYETVDGPYQANWFNALYAFLGLDFTHPSGGSKTVKTGSRTCEDRMVKLGGPSLKSLESVAPQSRVECLRMKTLAMAGNTTTSAAAMQQMGLGDLLLPPSDGRCRLGPNCRQIEYGKFQDDLLKRPAMYQG
ncbi:expressed unknown protein [Seminavis robusta]|uniref:Uncharacterized protein n=1 Tax=Seminavis robusta TaxID=568900 RepID=A0A9N8H3R0_9STRA|nr:expressed unknown protein [Seminavis robusta]|eukprot:Sro93_g048700.1 n/a (412) ;mRNA; f:108628-109863